jgi:hypothetical protein
MHAFTHEYTSVVVKGERMNKYIGSRCHNSECPESRNLARLPLLEASPYTMLFPRRSVVVKAQRKNHR